MDVVLVSLESIFSLPHIPKEIDDTAAEVIKSFFFVSSLSSSFGETEDGVKDEFEFCLSFLFARSNFMRCAWLRNDISLDASAFFFFFKTRSVPRNGYERRQN